MRTLLIVFSSAFKITIPAKLHYKLLTDLIFPVTVCDCILHFLLCCKQTVKVGNFISGSEVLNTGIPQGCVLSPLLYSLLIHDCTAYVPNLSLRKFADDLAVISLTMNYGKSDFLNKIEQLVK